MEGGEHSAFSRQHSAVSSEERQEIVILSEAKDLLFSARAKFSVRDGAVERERHSLYQGKLEPEISGAGPILEVR